MRLSAYGRISLSLLHGLLFLSTLYFSMIISFSVSLVNMNEIGSFISEERNCLSIRVHPLYKTKKYAACRKYGFYYLNASLYSHIWQAKWLILLASFKGCPYLYMNTLLQILLYMNIAYFLYAVYTSTR